VGENVLSYALIDVNANAHHVVKVKRIEEKQKDVINQKEGKQE